MSQRIDKVKIIKIKCVINIMISNLIGYQRVKFAYYLKKFENFFTTSLKKREREREIWQKQIKWSSLYFIN